MVSEEAVRWSFRLILGREPENERIVQQHMRLDTIEALRKGLFASQEFQAKISGSQLPPIWVWADVAGGDRRMRINLGDAHVSMGCLRDDYEHLETAVLRAVLRNDDTFIDIGANIGWYTIIASTIITPPGSIIAFEPRPETAANLRLSLEENRLTDLVRLFEAGLADHAQQAKLTWLAGTDNPGGSHLGSGDSVGSEFAEISLITLDSLELSRCDVIKMDVEGAEFRVIKGGEQTLRAQQPLILSELHPQQLVARENHSTD